jgi:hypothetical protein
MSVSVRRAARVLLLQAIKYRHYGSRRRNLTAIGSGPTPDRWCDLATRWPVSPPKSATTPSAARESRPTWRTGGPLEKARQVAAHAPPAPRSSLIGGRTASRDRCGTAVEVVSYLLASRALVRGALAIPHGPSAPNRQMSRDRDRQGRSPTDGAIPLIHRGWHHRSPMDRWAAYSAACVFLRGGLQERKQLVAARVRHLLERDCKSSYAEPRTSLRSPGHSWS